MTVFLLALGPGRHEIYSEPPEEIPEAPPPSAGRWRQWAHRAGEQWRELVSVAQRGEAQGRLARWRDAAVCHLAESIAEQRTLWSLRKAEAATLCFPSSMSDDEAQRVMARLLRAARWHHGVWFAVDGLLLIASALLAPIPGPNALAYYLAFRVVGHAQSALGAHRGMTRVAWTRAADERLTELATLAREPQAQREARVDAIAAQLRLHRFAAYFDRVAR